MDPKQSRGKERRCKGLPEGKKIKRNQSRKMKVSLERQWDKEQKEEQVGKRGGKQRCVRGWFDVPVPSILEYGSLVLTKTPQQAVRPRKPPSNQISC